MRAGPAPLALWLLLLAGLAASGPAHAQGDDRLALEGRVEGYGAFRVAEDPAFLAARSRAYLGLRYDYDRGRIAMQARMTHSALRDEAPGVQSDIDLRAAYAEAFLGRVDVRLGLQPLVWGKADGLFVADLLAPLDLSDFLTEPADDLRLPVLALRATAFLGDFEPEVVLIPRRPVSRLPGEDSPWYPLPDAAFGIPIRITEPAAQDSSLAAAEVALRLTWRGLPRTDLAAFWVNGFNRLPAFRKGLDVRFPPLAAEFVVTPAYERRQVVGVTAETSLLEPYVLVAEAAFHTAALLDQRVEIPEGGLGDPDFQDAVARGFLLERPILSAVVGAERGFGVHIVRVQGAGTVVFDYDERIAVRPFEPSVTAFWLARLRRETLTPRVFALYNPGKDFWINPELTYAVQDGLNVSAGAHVFGGRGARAGDLAGLLREPGFRFATYRGNSLVYLRATYAF